MSAYDLSMCEDIAVKIQPLRVRMKNYLTLTGRTYETWMEHEWNEKIISLYSQQKNQIKPSCQEPRPHSVLWHWNVLVHGQKFPGMLNVFFPWSEPISHFFFQDLMDRFLPAGMLVLMNPADLSRRIRETVGDLIFAFAGDQKLQKLRQEIKLSFYSTGSSSPSSPIFGEAILDCLWSKA